MDYKKAVEFFEKKLEDGKCSDICPDCNSSELAVTACRKQVPTFVECPGGWQGYRYTRYLCPACGKLTRQNEKYCHNCGQHVKYPTQKVVDNKIVLCWDDTESPE